MSQRLHADVAIRLTATSDSDFDRVPDGLDEFITAEVQEFLRPMIDYFRGDTDCLDDVQVEVKHSLVEREDANPDAA